MKKIYLLFILVTATCYSQDYEKLAKTELKALAKDFETGKEKLELEVKEHQALKDKLNTDAKEEDYKKLDEQAKKTKEEEAGVIYTYKKAQITITDYEIKGVSRTLLLEYFPHTFNIEETTGDESKDQKILYYFGKGKVIGKDNAIFENETAMNVFKETLLMESKTYLGDFIIPRKDQLITLYQKAAFLKYKFVRTESNNKVKLKKSHGEEKRKSKILKVTQESLNERIKGKKRKEVKKFDATNLCVKYIGTRIHMLEGSIYDIQVKVLDEIGNQELLFENTSPISLMRYTSISANNYLYFKGAVSKNSDEVLEIDKYKDLRIRLSDVLFYIPNPGDNYFPEDLTLEFPLEQKEEKKDENGKTVYTKDNVESAVNYKVNHDTSLENIVELRTYTDFLGLFTDSPNGIVQLEGKADFYVLPFNIPNSRVYFFKKLSPFVNFSKLDGEEENKYLGLTSYLEEETNTLKDSISHPLEILEKSYLEMGAKLTFFSFRIKKEYPFDINLYIPARYQIANIRNNQNEHVNYKSFGLGAGLLLEFRRYNNFGFNFGFEVTRYDASSFNEIEGFQNPDLFWTTRYDAEVYYFPGKTKAQSVFLRLKTHNNSTDGNHEAFYQLQFGYRFSIGVSKLTK